MDQRSGTSIKNMRLYRTRRKCMHLYARIIPNNNKNNNNNNTRL